MKTAVVYVHGKGGSAAEAAHYRALFPAHDVIGFAYSSATPWEAKAEFPPFFEEVQRKHASVTLIANSIGAYFALHALSGQKLRRAFLISPVVDMEALILQMLASTGQSELDLQRCGTVETAFGETLSWEYLCYVRAHPLCWHAPTCVLCGGKDTLTAPGTMQAFAQKTGAELTVMPDGEHWFHTAEQMRFLDLWIKKRSDF
ncbi:MAG: alpha/beta hydrolase [Oscillospiraceae bacterium]|nr:alpha/beta hydrolase [Oscillospiraceae bacterium]